IHLSEGYHPDAQLRPRADAIRLAVPGRGCGAHRAADRCERAESRGRRRAGPGHSARVLLRGRFARSARPIFRDSTRAHLGSRAFFVVDDFDAAPLRRRRSDAPALADRPAESSCEFAGVADRARGKLCWFAAGGASRRLGRCATDREAGHTLAAIATSVGYLSRVWFRLRSLICARRRRRLDRSRLVTPQAELRYKRSQSSKVTFI